MCPSEEFPCAGTEQLLVSVRSECPRQSWTEAPYIESRLSETSAERPRSAAKILNGEQQFDNLDTLAGRACRMLMNVIMTFPEAL
jgi:hypothetical protein